MTILHARLKYGLAMIVIVALLALTFVWPIRSKIISANRRLVDLQRELDQFEVTMQQIEALRTQLDTVRQRQDLEMKLIPQRPDLPGLIQDVTRHIADLPLHGSNVNRSHDQNLSREESLGLVIETDGTFAGVHELLKRIEDLPRLICINEITLRHEPTAEDDATVTASIDISAFYRPESRNSDNH